jgi:hypothetical protein
VDEPAHEADGAAADQEQEYEDVERGHGLGASKLFSSLRAQRSNPLARIGLLRRLPLLAMTPG